MSSQQRILGETEEMRREAADADADGILFPLLLPIQQATAAAAQEDEFLLFGERRKPDNQGHAGDEGSLTLISRLRTPQ